MTTSEAYDRIAALERANAELREQLKYAETELEKCENIGLSLEGQLHEAVEQRDAALLRAKRWEELVDQFLKEWDLGMMGAVDRLREARELEGE